MLLWECNEEHSNAHTLPNHGRDGGKGALNQVNASWLVIMRPTVRYILFLHTHQGWPRLSRDASRTVQSSQPKLLSAGVKVDQY